MSKSARKSTKAIATPVTVVSLAAELGLNPKNARRIARSMFTQHEKNTKWGLSPEQVAAFKARVAKNKSA